MSHYIMETFLIATAYHTYTIQIMQKLTEKNMRNVPIYSNPLNLFFGSPEISICINWSSYQLKRLIQHAVSNSYKFIYT